MSKKRKYIYAPASAIFVLFMLLVMACGRDTSNAPDVSNISANVKIQRFDQEIFGLDTARLTEALPALAQKYPDFLPTYIQEVIIGPGTNDITPEAALTGFVKAPQVRRLYDSCQAHYSDLGWLEKDLTPMVKYYKHYFPQNPIPRFVTCVTEFVGDAYVINDSLVMLGLDMFLGKDFIGYNPETFPAYIRRQFSREYIPAKTALALASYQAGPTPGDRILDHMIHNGKILYIMDCLLPETPDSIKMGYTRAQMEGCYANEQEVWAKLLDLKVLYEPLGKKNQKIVMPSPSADLVFTESPGEIGNWVGWQIVKSYMKRNPQTSMQDLVNFKDSQQFLEKARYKPKKEE